MKRCTMEEKQELVAECAGSGLSIEAFCKEKGLTYNTYSRMRQDVEATEKYGYLGDKYTPEDRVKLVKEWRDSGEPLCDFAPAHGVLPSVFTAWAAHVKAHAPTPKLYDAADILQDIMFRYNAYEVTYRKLQVGDVKRVSLWWEVSNEHL